MAGPATAGTTPRWCCGEPVRPTDGTLCRLGEGPAISTRARVNLPGGQPLGEGDDRFPSCSAFARGLVDDSRGQGIPSASATTQAAPKALKSARASAATPPVEPSATGSSRRAWVVLGSVAAVMLLVAIVGWVWRPWGNQQFKSASTTSTTAALTDLTSANVLPLPPPSAVTPAPRASTTATTVDPALTGPADGSDCAHAQINVVTTSSSGTPIRCTSGPGGYSWQPDTGTGSPEPALIGQMGWDKCITQSRKRNALRPQQPSSIPPTLLGRCSLREPTTSRTRCPSVPARQSRGRERVPRSTSTTAPGSSMIPAPTPMRSISQSSK